MQSCKGWMGSNTSSKFYGVQSWVAITAITRTHSLVPRPRPAFCRSFVQPKRRAGLGTRLTYTVVVDFLLSISVISKGLHSNSACPLLSASMPFLSILHVIIVTFLFEFSREQAKKTFGLAMAWVAAAHPPALVYSVNPCMTLLTTTLIQ